MHISITQQIVACIFPSYVLSMRVLYYVIYLWSKQNPNTPRSFWGITIQGFYIPFALMALSLLMGSPITDHLISIATGHFFYYFSQVCEQTRNSKLFVTPHSLYCSQFVMMDRRRMLGLQEVGLNKKDDDLYRRKWVGTGHRLGSNM